MENETNGAAKLRKLDDEAREVVVRLRGIDINIIRSSHMFAELLYRAVMGRSWPDYTELPEDFADTRDRLIELIEHGSTPDVDVAALRELADDLESLEVTASSAEFASGYGDGCKYAAERIRKAIEGATVPDAESDAERSCAALLEWRDQVAGLLGIDSESIADEVQDAIMAELDKRLMPPGMEWPRFDDGEMVNVGDYILHDGKSERVQGIYLYKASVTLSLVGVDHEKLHTIKYGERVKRPEPEVLGADGLPIEQGQTVYYAKGPNATAFVASEIHGDMVRIKIADEPDGALVFPGKLTHTPPETQDRIDDDVVDFANKCAEYTGRASSNDWFAVEVREFLRRQRELDAKTGGE